MTTSSFERPHFVVNARAAQGRDGRRLRAIRGEITRRFSAPAWTETTVPGDAVRLARQAVEGGADVVVAVGGDGTINEVVNGLMTASSRPPLAILPAGSGSDFVRTIKVPHRLDVALQIICDGRVRRVDVAEICCDPVEGAAIGPAAGSSTAVTRRYFMNIAGCGASGRVVQRFNKRHVPGTLGYVVASGLTALDYKFPDIDIALDDHAADRITLNVLFICNGEYCGGGMHVGNGAKVDDGLLQVVEVAGVGRIGSMLQWPALYTGHLSKVKGVRVRSAQAVHISSPGPDEVLVDCDGELCGRLPATYRIVPSALDVCVPA